LRKFYELALRCAISSICKAHGPWGLASCKVFLAKGMRLSTGRALNCDINVLGPDVRLSFLVAGPNASSVRRKIGYLVKGSAASSRSLNSQQAHTQRWLKIPRSTVLGKAQASQELGSSVTLQHSLPSGLNLLKLEALAAVLFSIFILVFQSRPRGWCNHSLVQVCHNSRICTKFCSE